MKRKILALLTGAVMCFAMLPSLVFADDVSADTGDGSEGNPFTSITDYADNVKNFGGDASVKSSDVYVVITGETFDSENPFKVPNTQSYQNPPKLHLTLKDCKFTGNTAADSTNPSFMYLPNCQELNIDGCTFDAGESGLKYGINWNLIGIQDAKISITNSTFDGNYEKNAIKLNQRNGADDVASDVKSGNTTPATIADAVISGCTFNSESAKIALGSQGKGNEGAASPSTGEFPVRISGNTTAVSVALDYAAAEGANVETIDLAAGNDLVKTESVSSDNLTVKYTRDGNVTYYIGTADEIQDIANDAKSGDEIVILKGDIDLQIKSSDVKVTNNGDGEVTANGIELKQGYGITTENPEQGTTNPSVPSDTSNQGVSSENGAAGNSPKTGDDFNMTAVIALMGIAAAAAAGTVVYGRRKRSN
ncbi:MAG: LPXTG cell wall anchor domain-containing protein [Anaerovoracaceae bacterium]